MSLPNLVNPFSIIPSSIRVTGVNSAVDNVFTNGTIFTVPADSIYIVKRIDMACTLAGATRFFYAGKDSGIPLTAASYYTMNLGSSSSFTDTTSRIFLETQGLFYKLNSNAVSLTYDLQVDIYK